MYAMYIIWYAPKNLQSSTAGSSRAHAWAMIINLCSPVASLGRDEIRHNIVNKPAEICNFSGAFDSDNKITII